MFNSAVSWMTMLTYKLIIDVVLLIIMFIKFQFQAHSTTITEAQRLAQPDKIILVGGKRHCRIEPNDAVLALSLVEESHDIATINNAGIFVWSAFFPSHGYQGTLHRLEEHCYYNTATNDLTAMKITDIFAWNISGQYYLFAKGMKYRVCGVHIYSDNPIVCASDEECVVLLKQVKRKIMLYPLEDGKYAIIDHQRTNIPLCPKDVPVPQYPESGDIVSVNG